MYPDLKEAYGLAHSLRMIFAKNTIKNAASLLMTKWYNKVKEAGFHSFNVIVAIFYEHYQDILNFYNHRTSNVAAESFNANIKLFRANLRWIADRSFFLFRLAKLFVYPTEFLLDLFSPSIFMQLMQPLPFLHFTKDWRYWFEVAQKASKSRGIKKGAPLSPNLC